MIAAVSGLIGLLIFIGIAVISSLLKRKEEEPFELPPELKPRRDRPPPPPAAPGRWEEELRRVLEDHTPPPSVMPHRPAPPGPRLPPPVFEPPGDEAGIEIQLPVPRPRIEPAFQKLPGLTESHERFAGATQLQERVAQHMAGVTRHRVGTTVATHAATSVEATDAAQALRTRRGLRTALIGSIILGPPRALEG